MKFSTDHLQSAGWWIQGDTPPESGNESIHAAILDLNRSLVMTYLNEQFMVCRGGTVVIGEPKARGDAVYPLAAYTPPILPHYLGDPLFKKCFHLRYAYIVGAMANGITSVKMVEAAGRAGMLGFFGSAGLSLTEIETAIDRLQRQLNSVPFGFNLIHTPNEPEYERKMVELYLKRGVSLVSASAYMDMTLPLIYFRVKGIHQDPGGKIIFPNRIIAKASRVEVVRKFFSPPPEKILRQLLERNMVTQQEFELARFIPMADSLTAEADSGGHTDNQQAISLLPTMLALRDEMAAKYKFKSPLFVGLAGGISTPASTAGAFAMGAAYVLTGSINQSCVEAGTSETVRHMLAEADQADVIMAPAADMFELGVKVQVLKRGTMFPFRATKLYDLYCRYDNYASIPQKDRTLIERDIFRGTFKEEWERTKQFFTHRDPRQLEQAEKDPKHQMALVFRSYLGQTSNWANSGEPSRKIDYQIWCGPSMGAFNHWVKGSFLEKPENRKILTVAMNLLFGAAVATRVNWLRNQGVVLPERSVRFVPIELTEIEKRLNH